MHVALYRRHAHADERLRAFASGLKRHGVARTWADAPVDADLAVIWGVQRRDVIARQRAAGRRFLVLECGYVGDRLAWTSAGFDGLNGRAIFPEAGDGGERFERHFGDLVHPWREPGTGEYTLLLGQVSGDAAVVSVDLARWYGEIADIARGALGLPVFFRPHPKRPDERVAGVPRLDSSLAEALERAACAVTWNSTAGVNAALAGVPVFAMDEGSMAWPVAMRTFADGLITPDRSDWTRRLAWTQWQLDELADGTAWERLRTVIA